MKSMIRQFADKLSFKLLKWSPVRKIVDFMGYQRKRLLRREVEARLRQSGKYGDEVIRGPFRGLVYPAPEHWASCRFEKIFGIYEFELYPALEALLASEKKYTSVVVIGAAEGFYVAGMARRLHGVRVFAFEPLPQRVDVMRKLLEINDVADQVTIEGFCNPDILNKTDFGDTPLVICDVDGYEDVIMSVEDVPMLARADIILELHDFIIANVSEKVRKRFAATHDIEVISVSSPAYEDYPILRDLPMNEIHAMTESDRPYIQDWYIMRSK
jgi:hypothetical protein